MSDLVKRLLNYADDLDFTERPAAGEYDVTADIRALCGQLENARSVLRECANRLRYDGDLFHDQGNEMRRDASWRAQELAEAALTDEDTQRATVEKNFAGRTGGASVQDHTFAETDKIHQSASVQRAPHSSDERLPSSDAAGAGADAAQADEQGSSK